jgi:peptide/nickel transport system ATP-binding protein
MRQRVMIAIALACNPDLLIADEPTTALDVTIQAQILTLIDRLKVEFGSAVIVITHDMGVVAQIAETVAVMYAGQIVEQGGVDAVFASPQHPYAWGLLGSIPRLDRPKPGRLPTIRGLPPSLIDLPEGCAFAPRCDHTHAACRIRPELLPRSGPAHLDRCVLTPEQKTVLRRVDTQVGAV